MAGEQFGSEWSAVQSKVLYQIEQAILAVERLDGENKKEYARVNARFDELREKIREDLEEFKKDMAGEIGTLKARLEKLAITVGIGVVLASWIGKALFDQFIGSLAK